MNLDTRQDERAMAPHPGQSPSPETGLAPDDLERPVALNSQPSNTADDALAPLFTPEAARDFRASWDAVQIGFVDDPQRAVRQADELVRQMLQNLEQTFSNDRAALDAQGEEAAQAPSTEKLRLALRRYRAFMQRLLAL